MIDVDRVQHTDALTGLRSLPDDSVDCIVTSPPYWATRDYGLAPITWNDGSRAVLGLETEIGAYVAHLCEILDEAMRVLKPRGTLWLNLGDVYSIPERLTAIRRLSEGAPAGPTRMSWTSLPDGHPATKSLCMIPERVALAMIGRGWILRNKVVWQKTNHMPTSVRDRLACSWEYLFMFSRSPKYYFDLDAIRVPHRSKPPVPPAAGQPRESKTPASIIGVRPAPDRNDPRAWHPLGRNPGDCWSMATVASRTGHPAPFPVALAERPILAGCPTGGLVLDPFIGSGTTGIAALGLGRHFLGFEASAEYADIAQRRIQEAVWKGLIPGKQPDTRQPTGSTVRAPEKEETCSK